MLPNPIHASPHKLHLPPLRCYFPIKSGLVESLEDFFHPGAGGDAHLLQVVAGKGWLDIAEFVEKSLDMLLRYRGTADQVIGGNG